MKKIFIFGILAIMMAMSATFTFAQTNAVESKISQALAYYDSLVGTQQVPAKDLEGFKAWVKKDREGFETFLKNFFTGDTLKFTDWYDSYHNVDVSIQKTRKEIDDQTKKNREDFDREVKQNRDKFDSLRKSEKGEVTAAVLYEDGATIQLIEEKSKLREVTPEELKKILKEYEPIIRENSLKSILKEHKQSIFQIAEGVGVSLSSARTRVDSILKLAGLNPYHSSFEFQKWGYKEYHIIKVVVVK